jgi:hypothetical protein
MTHRNFTTLDYFLAFATIAWATISVSVHTHYGAVLHTLKIWMIDPEVVIDKIVVGDINAGYMEPPETAVQ